MNRVLDRLWIGSNRDLDGTTPLPSLGFCAVVDLRDGPHRPIVGGTMARTGTAPVGLEVFRLDNRDGDPWDATQIESALSFIADRIRFGKVLVACMAGMSRSVSMVVGYLVRTGWDVTEAFEHVKHARPESTPVPAMLEAVIRAAD